MSQTIVINLTLPDGSVSIGGVAGNVQFADAEVPVGDVDGVNDTFTLSKTPSPSSSLLLVHADGAAYIQGLHYTLTGNEITFFSLTIPRSGDYLNAYYRY